MFFVPALLDTELVRFGNSIFFFKRWLVLQNLFQASLMFSWVFFSILVNISNLEA